MRFAKRKFALNPLAIHSKQKHVLYICKAFCYIEGVKTVSYARTAIKALKSIPAKDRNAIMDKMDAYADGRPQDVIALKGSDFLRLRHRDWRVVFEESVEAITVLDVAHRRDVYR